MKIYFYAASLTPSIGLLIFLLIEIARRKLFFRTIRKVCIMVLIVFVSTVASASVGVFIDSTRHHSSNNPGAAFIFLPVLNGVLLGSFLIVVFIVLKIIVKYAIKLYQRIQ